MCFGSLSVLRVILLESRTHGSIEYANTATPKAAKQPRTSRTSANICDCWYDVLLMTQTVQKAQRLSCQLVKCLGIKPFVLLWSETLKCDKCAKTKKSAMGQILCGTVCIRLKMLLCSGSFGVCSESCMKALCESGQTRSWKPLKTLHIPTVLLSLPAVTVNWQIRSHSESPADLCLNSLFHIYHCTPSLVYTQVKYITITKNILVSNDLILTSIEEKFSFVSVNFVILHLGSLTKASVNSSLLFLLVFMLSCSTEFCWV